MTSKQERRDMLKVLAPTMASSDASASDRDNVQCKVPKKLCFTVVVLGASGDLAKKKTFPALFLLYSRGCACRYTCACWPLAQTQCGTSETWATITSGKCSMQMLEFFAGSCQKT